MLKTRKRFGQHFLHDPGILRRIVEAIAPAAGETIVEIGPGEGALTGPLIERAGRLTAIEIDRDLAKGLGEAFGSRELSVLRADALELDYACFPHGFRLVGNLPYNISTPLLFRLARVARHARDMHFM
ncbi:MAG: rRNA adenine dimethyltransferase family protein, partial [Pseudomonadota bacterium]